MAAVRASLPGRVAGDVAKSDPNEGGRAGPVASAAALR